MSSNPPYKRPIGEDMSNSGDLPEMESMESTPDAGAVSEPVATAPTPGAATPPPAPMQVALSGMPAPAFGLRAQKEYYRFFFAGLIMFLGCLMPFGPEAELVGYKTLGGALFTLISLGIMWSSWIAITHGRFNMSNLRWLLCAFIPLTVMIYHLVMIFDEPAVQGYIAANAGDPSVIQSWTELWDRVIHFRTTSFSNNVDNFVRAYGTGKIVLMFGSLYAILLFFKGVGSGVKAGKAQKKASAAAREKTKGKSKSKSQGKRR